MILINNYQYAKLLLNQLKKAKKELSLLKKSCNDPYGYSIYLNFEIEDINKELKEIGFR